MGQLVSQLQTVALPKTDEQLRKSLVKCWNRFRRARPGLTMREGASLLRVSEYELLMADCGQSVVNIAPDCVELWRELELLGRVAVVIQSPSLTEEISACFRWAGSDGRVITLVDYQFELQLDLSRIFRAVAVTHGSSDAFRHSLQFFDVHGHAVIKILVTPWSDLAWYSSLVQRFRGRVRKSLYPADSESWRRRAKNSLVELSMETIREHWRRLRGEAELQQMLRKFGISRFQAIKLLHRHFSWPIAGDVLSDFMHTLTQTGMQVEIVTEHDGVRLCRIGVVRSSKRYRDCLLIQAEDYKLSLAEKAVDSVWSTHKPKAIQNGANLELFDATGGCLAIVSVGDSSEPLQCAVWRELVSALPLMDSVA